MSSQVNSCAVVVSFLPDFTALLKLLGQLNKETDFIVIDNGSADIAALSESILVYDRCKQLVRLEENEGLAKALNRGIKLCKAEGYDYILLFDQDSSLCDLFVSRMINAFEQAERLSKRPIAAVGPRIINPQSMRQTPFKLFNRFFFRSDRTLASSKTLFHADFLITSGTVLPVKHLESIGLMKESYFIDNLDLEWCFRAKHRGYDLVGTDEAILYHSIGERSLHPLVRSGIMAQHSPARTYYSSRNRIHLYKVSYAPWGWKLRDVVRFCIKASWLLLSSKERKEYWRYIRSGIRDARSIT